MGTKTPCPRQKTLNFTRGEQLSLRTAIQLPTTQKFLLWVLDDFIREKTSWTLSIAKIMNVSGLKETAVRDGLNALKDAMFIWWKTRADGRRDYFITWTNIEEAVEAQTSVDADDEDEIEDHEESGDQSDSPANGPMVRQMDHESAQRAESPANGPMVRQTDSYIRKNVLKTVHHTAPSTPTSSTAVGRHIEDELMLLVKDCGVDLFGPAVTKSLSIGFTPERIRETAEHFRSHPGRWEPNILYGRLTTTGNHLLKPNEGWPPQKNVTVRTTKSADPLESRFGYELDALPDVERLLDVLIRWRPHDRELIENRCPDDPRSHHDGRKILLETMNAIASRRQTAGAMPSGP